MFIVIAAFAAVGCGDLPEVKNVEFLTAPNSTYIQGTDITFEKFEVRMTFADDTIATVEIPEVSITNYNKDTLGEQEITVSFTYSGSAFSQNFKVTVVADTKVTGIELSSDIISKGFILVNTDLTDIKFRKVFNNGTKSEEIAVNASMISNFDKTKTGKQEVIITYEGLTAKFELIVADKIVTDSGEFADSLTNYSENFVIVIKEGEYLFKNVVTHQEKKSNIMLDKNISFYGKGNVVFKQDNTIASGDTVNFANISNAIVKFENIQFNQYTKNGISLNGKESVLYLNKCEFVGTNNTVVYAQNAIQLSSETFANIQDCSFQDYHFFREKNDYNFTNTAVLNMGGNAQVIKCVFNNVDIPFRVNEVNDNATGKFINNIVDNAEYGIILPSVKCGVEISGNDFQNIAAFIFSYNRSSYENTPVVIKNNNFNMSEKVSFWDDPHFGNLSNATLVIDNTNKINNGTPKILGDVTLPIM